MGMGLGTACVRRSIRLRIFLVLLAAVGPHNATAVRLPGAGPVKAPAMLTGSYK